MAVNAAAEPRERGSLKKQLAAYLHLVDEHLPAATAGADTDQP
jgi:hypothetical protein